MAHRAAKLASDIRRLVAPALMQCPTACGIVTITRVDVSRDVAFATVYITALEKADLALSFLERKSREIQRSFGALNIHRTPTLRFRIDEEEERANRVDALLKNIEN